MIESMADQDHDWMARAIELARSAEAAGEVPVGAIVVDADGKCIGEGFNRVIANADPTAHAEIIALRMAAGRQGNYRLPGTTMYVTLEPCSMCAGALINARVERVVYGADDPRAGASGSVFDVLNNPTLNHRCQVTKGVLAEQAGNMMREFFRKRRA